MNRFLQQKLDIIDDRMMQCWQTEQAYQLGISIGMLYQKQLDQWYNSGCKGEMPVPLQKHLTEHYVLRYLRKQWYKLKKGLK